MAKLCAADLNATAFPVGACVETMVAPISVIILHHRLEEVPTLSVFSDSADRHDITSVFVDGMADFGGKAID